MTKNKLASQLCALEGKKSEIKIGNMRETLRCLEILIAQSAVQEGERTAIRSNVIVELSDRAQKRLNVLWTRIDRAARKA